MGKLKALTRAISVFVTEAKYKADGTKAYKCKYIKVYVGSKKKIDSAVPVIEETFKPFTRFQVEDRGQVIPMFDAIRADKCSQCDKDLKG